MNDKKAKADDYNLALIQQSSIIIIKNREA